MIDLRATLGATELERDVVRVAGPEALAYLQGQLSQDVEDLDVGSTALSFLLAPTGKVDAWLRVTRRSSDEVVLDVDGGYGEAVLARLRRFLLRTKADIDPLDWQVVALRGPGAESAAADARDAAELVVPALWPRVEGADLLGPDVVELGAVDGVAVAPQDAYESLRIRSGVPALGAELTDATIPAEAGQAVIDASVDFTKGCFTGQELVARIDSRGGNVPRRVRGVLVARRPGRRGRHRAGRRGGRRAGHVRGAGAGGRHGGAGRRRPGRRAAGRGRDPAGRRRRRRAGHRRRPAPRGLTRPTRGRAHALRRPGGGGNRLGRRGPGRVPAGRPRPPPRRRRRPPPHARPQRRLARPARPGPPGRLRPPARPARGGRPAAATGAAGRVTTTGCSTTTTRASSAEWAEMADGRPLGETRCAVGVVGAAAAGHADGRRRHRLRGVRVHVAPAAGAVGRAVRPGPRVVRAGPAAGHEQEAVTGPGTRVPAMSEMTFIVKLTAAEGKRDELVEALGKLVDATEGEPGTLQYVLHTDTTEPDAVWFYEHYADQAAFEAHMGSPAMAEAMGSFGGLLGGPPDMRALEAVRRKGDGG